MQDVFIGFRFNLIPNICMSMHYTAQSVSANLIGYALLNNCGSGSELVGLLPLIHSNTIQRSIVPKYHSRP